MNENNPIEALQRAKNNNSVFNYQAILAGFSEKGIPLEDIKPRENVFTYKAWLAQNRQVMKGEHGVKITTWIVKEVKTDNGIEKKRIPTYPRVFHISQTKEV